MTQAFRVDDYLPIIFHRKSWRGRRGDRARGQDDAREIRLGRWQSRDGLDCVRFQGNFNIMERGARRKFIYFFTRHLGVIRTMGVLTSCLVLMAGCRRADPVRDGHLVFIGDSLTSSYGGVTEEETYPSLLGQKWGRETLNFSVPGMRGTGAEGWVEKILKEAEEIHGRPSAVFIALGANDQLGGLDPEQTRISLKKIVEAAGGGDSKVFLIQCLVPLRSRGYEDMYHVVSTESGAGLAGDIVGAYLAAAGGRGEDGIHPTEAGHQAIARSLDEDLGDFFER